jgi:hypothetical protein
MYAGTDANARANTAPGGFGQALYPTSAGNSTGGRGGAAGRTGAGGLAGRGGGLGGSTTGTEYGTIVAQPVQIMFPAVPKFASTPIAAPKLQADLAGMLARSPSVNAAGVQVIAEGHTVTLRGTAKSEDEARTIAGMVRMTPGVREVRNELTIPRP